MDSGYWLSLTIEETKFVDRLNTYQPWNHEEEEPPQVTSGDSFSLATNDGFHRVQMHQLEMELHFERSLNRLSDRLLHSLLATAQPDPSDAAQLTTEVLQPIANELRATLGATIAGIALPDLDIESVAGDCLTPSPFISTFKICAVAPYESQRQGQQTAMGLATGQKIRFGLGEAIAVADLQALHDQPWAAAWPIVASAQTLGWLIAIDSPSESSSSDGVWEFQLRTRFLQGVSRHCGIALQKLHQYVPYCPHCQTLEQRNRQLERTNQLKSEFLANTSHEIRTPLSSILGFTHLLREQGYNVNSTRHREYLNIILTSGQHLLALINDILDLSKIEANQLNLQWETAKVEDLCRSVLLLVKEKASDKGLELRLDIDPNATTFVVDPLRLKQMLFNLLSNALKFTVRGAVGLQVRLVGVFLHFTVWDTGTGISKEQQNQLFRPYSQIANNVVSPGEGTGLGLSLTRRLAELHGGWVAVESEPNRGSRFTIALPLTPRVIDQSEAPTECTELVPAPLNPLHSTRQPEVRAEVSPPRSSLSNVTPLPTGKQRRSDSRSTVPLSLRTHTAPTTRSAAPGAALSGNPTQHQPLQTIARAGDGKYTSTANPRHHTKPTPVAARSYHLLLVEDHPPNAKLMIAYLSKMGYEVTWARNADEMWHALTLSQPALILMDVHLPQTDGLTLTRQLRQQPQYQQLPIIAQTAMAMSGDRQLCLEAGATDYITKPIDLNTLGELVSHYSHNDRYSD